MKLLRYITGLFLALFLLAYMPGLAEAFTDTRQHWARPEIDHLQSRDIITGYPDGTYRPEGYISRQEFITLVIKALHGEKEAGVLQKGSSFFQDVNGSWAQGYIELAQEMRIAHGDGHGNFMPLRPVSVKRQSAYWLIVWVGPLVTGAAWTSGMMAIYPTGRGLLWPTRQSQAWSKVFRTVLFVPVRI
ncbi:S-layer homology domain-containing protein [Syntrophomonas palmitatica]|uniref:S-layer homology domain-containing protein n=1 Tax=Syntrophomonas palmitatica TaxID=402877 RepID=UPI0006D005DF|nr:S-layer homology domain-containing protein [Syntrophomonas palmitatica]